MRGCSLELTTLFRFGIREASGIDDQRTTIRRDFDVQQIVMTVTTVSDWATIEDEIFRVSIPAAALNVITTVRKTRVCLYRCKKIFAIENRRGELQQIRVVSGVGIRQRWYQSIWPLNVQQKLASFFETLVVTSRERQTKTNSVLARAQKRT